MDGEAHGATRVEAGQEEASADCLLFSMKKKGWWLGAIDSTMDFTSACTSSGPRGQRHKKGRDFSGFPVSACISVHPGRFERNCQK